MLPVTGPYQIGELKKGKSVTFDRVKDWWGNDERYFQHRFNPDRIEIISNFPVKEITVVDPIPGYGDHVR